MELKILNIYYVETVENLTNVVKSIEWIFGETSGTLELDEPNENNFIDFELVTTEILKNWVKQKIDFKKFNTELTPIIDEEIILKKSFVE